MKKKQSKCVYCRKVRNTTDEHVVPKGLYIIDHKIVIPCCEQCNNTKAKDDEYFRLVLSVLEESKGHPVAQEVIKKVERSLQNPKQKLYGDMIRRSANNILIQDFDRNVVSRKTGLDVEINRINQTFGFIIQALIYLETHYYLPSNFSVTSTFGHEEETEEGSNLLHNIRATLENESWKEIGEGKVFEYRYAVIQELPSSVWEMQIYNGKRVVTIVHKST